MQVKRLLHLNLASLDDRSVHCKPSRLGTHTTCIRYKAKALHAEKQTDRLRMHSHWHQYPCITCACDASYSYKCRACGHLYKHKHFNSVTIKNLAKIVKYFEFLAKGHSTITGNTKRCCFRQNCVLSLLCAACAYLCGLPKNRACAETTCTSANRTRTEFLLI